MSVASLALLSACTTIYPETTTRSTAKPDRFVTTTSEPAMIPLCLPEDGLRVDSFSIAATGPFSARAEIALSSEADVAVACALDSDPSEVHLVEATGADHYTLDIGGLLQDSLYRCEAVAVCPTSQLPGAEAEVLTERASAETPTATAAFSDDLQMTGIYTLTNAQPDCTGGPDRDQWLVIWDPLGRPRWLYQLPPDLNVGIEARWHGDALVWGGGDHSAGAPARVDLFDGEIDKTSFPGASSLVFHHDGKQLPDGRILTTSETLEQPWASFQLHVVDPETDTVDWSYHSDQAVNQGAITPYGYYDTEDPWHLNWADVVGDQAIVSLCHSWMIAGIDIPTSQVSWRFGVNGDFALQDADGAPLGWEDFPQCQHGLEFDGESLLVYDNGSLNKWSRAAEFSLDFDAKVARRTWLWTEPGWFETSLGDVDWLTEDHSRVLVTKAHPECFSPSPASVSEIVEVDQATNTVVHRLTFDEPETANYRAERIDGCDIFRNGAYCQEVATRLVWLRPLFGLAALRR